MRRLLVCLFLAIATPATAAETKVAVAANFTEAAQAIGPKFTAATGHTAVFSFGSTGQLYTQITQGAPFEVFLAADQGRPEKAEAEGHGVKGSRFTYATGKIVLFSKDPALVKGASTLETGSFQKLAIANPETAPYGAAAVAALTKLDLYTALQPKLVQGTNISQTLQFVDTGSAELGFVALAQVIKLEGGSRWIVPDDLYPTIAQDAVLLVQGKDSAAAKAFLDFLKGAEARAVIAEFGYGTGD